MIVYRHAESDEKGIPIMEAIRSVVDREDIVALNCVRDGKEFGTKSIVYPGMNFNFQIHQGYFGPIQKEYNITIVKIDDHLDTSFIWTPKKDKVSQ